MPSPWLIEAVFAGIGLAPDHQELLAGLLVFVGDLERIGHFGVVVAGVAAAGRRDGMGRIDLHRPVDQVDDVAAEIGQNAAAVVPEIAPVERESIGVEGRLGAGPSQKS